MDYRTLVAIHFKGEFEPATFQNWLDANKHHPLLMRLKAETGELWIGVEGLKPLQKETCVRQAIEQGLDIELVFKDEEEMEQSYPFPMTDANHPLLEHDITGKTGFIRLKPQCVQICLKETRGDQLAQWLLQAWECLKSELANHPNEVRQKALKFVIKSCEQSKNGNKAPAEKIEQTLMSFQGLNERRGKQGEKPHTAEVLFYRLPIKEDEIRPLYGAVGIGSCIGLAYTVLLLFNFLEEIPVLQTYVLQQLNKDCA